jgi:peptidyl-tRNA hydrolase, PTH1 family
VPLFRRGPSKHAAGDRWIVAGLGNPGDRYAGTRHNAGAMVLTVLLDRTGASLKRHKSGSLVAETTMEGRRVVLARAMTFMNESGRPLGELVRWYKTPAEQFVVVHDEIDIPFGTVRIKVGGGTAGHNGLRSIESHLGTRDFLRVRVGVGRPRGLGDATDHVLNDFSASERKELPDVLSRAADAVEMIIASGSERAMNEVNARQG